MYSYFKNLSVSLIVVFLGIIIFANDVLAANPIEVVCPPGDFRKEGNVCIPTGTELPDTPGYAKNPVVEVITDFMLWILGVFGVIAVIAFGIAGIQYLVAAGDPTAIETAKRNMKWSIVGVIVGLGGLVIIQAIDALLNAYSSM